MLSDTIKELRRKNYLNQTAFANKIGVTQSAVSQWEHDLTKPNSEQLKMISTVFNISVDDLLRGENSPGPTDQGAPRTQEARLVSFAMDSMPKEQREKILNVFNAMYPGIIGKDEG